MEYEGIPRIDSISLFPLVPIEPCAELCFVVQHRWSFFFLFCFFVFLFRVASLRPASKVRHSGSSLILELSFSGTFG